MRDAPPVLLSRLTTDAVELDGVRVPPLEVGPGVTVLVGPDLLVSKVLAMLAGQMPAHAPFGHYGTTADAFRRQRVHVGSDALLSDADLSLTVDDWLHLMAELWAVRAPAVRPAAERERWNLTGVRRRRLGALSVGMRHQALLAASLVPRPALWILDDPAAHLDHEGVRRLERIVSGTDRGWCPPTIVVAVRTPLQVEARQVIRVGDS